jgi:TolB-like protein/Flp pilus assembly protein TadD
LSFFAELRRRNVFRVGIAYVVVAWLILQVADVILNNIEAPDWVFETILLVLLIGLPIVLLFAWAFELTPEGLKREKDVDRTQSIAPQTGKRLDRTIIVVLALALAYFAIDKFYLGTLPTGQTATTVVESAPDGPAEAAEKSIAVLPLANRSNREEDRFFTDGMHDDLLTQLAKISSLKVISRTSVMRYRDTELPIPEIASQLRVNTILEGGIQRAGDFVRINVQLIDANTDEHLWAETYDREMTAENLFAIQSEITREIIRALKATLTPEEAARLAEKPTENLDALQEYMKGQQELAARTVAQIQEAKGHFERALELDPGFAQARAALANAYHLLFEYAGLAPEESLDPAMALLEEALQQAPNLGEAYLVRAEIYRHRDEFDAAEADFLRAQELLPGNATVYHWFSFLRSAQGREDEHYALLEKAHQLDPMSAVIHANWAMRPFNEGRDEETLAELERVKNLHPAYPFTYGMEAWIYYSQGNPVETLRAQLKILELDPASTRTGFQCFSFFNLNALEAGRKCVEEFEGPRQGRRLFAELEMHLLEGNLDAVRSMIAERMEDPQSGAFVSYASLLVGDLDEAVNRFSNWRPDWFDPEAEVKVDPEGDDRDGAISAAYLLQQTGQASRADQLLNAALQTLAGNQRNRGAGAFGFDDAAIYALLGQTENALSALEEAAELDYLSDWASLKFSPWYDDLRGDPRFDSVINRLSSAADEARKQAEAEGLL